MKLRATILTAFAVLAISAPLAQAQTLAADATAANAVTYVAPPASGGGGSAWGYTALGLAAILLIAGAYVGSLRLTSLTRDANRALRTS